MSKTFLTRQRALGDFLRYHDQKSSRYVIRSRGLVSFEMLRSVMAPLVKMMMGSMGGMIL